MVHIDAVLVLLNSKKALLRFRILSVKKLDQLAVV